MYSGRTIPNSAPVIILVSGVLGWNPVKLRNTSMTIGVTASAIHHRPGNDGEDKRRKNGYRRSERKKLK